MTPFRVPQILLAGLALSLSAVVAATAQGPGPPLLLTPPPVPSAEAAEPSAPPTDTPAVPMIAVDALAPPKPDAMGLVDARGGGFPDDMWRDSAVEPVRALIAALPSRYASLTARHLAVRFLLSAVPPP